MDCPVAPANKEPLLEVKITEAVDLIKDNKDQAEAGFDQRYRVPGTTMKYQCSEGFDIGNGDNPVQSLTCTAGRKVDFSGLTQCRRKSLWSDLSF